MVAGNLPPDGPAPAAGWDGPPPPVNVATPAAGATANASSTFEPQNYPASGVIDGNDGSAWVSNVNNMNGQWVRIDLGQARTIRAYRVLNGNTYINGWNLQSSPNDSTWTTRASGTGPGDTGVTDITPVTAEFWRVFFTSGSQGNQTHAVELLA